MILVELAVLIGALLFPTKFELKSVLTLLPIAVLLGTVAAFASRGNGDLSHLFLVAGSECCLVVSYTVGCALAYRLRRSAVVLCGIFAGLNKMFLQIGKAASIGIIDMLGGTTLTHCLLFSIVTLITIAATAILIKNSDLVDRLSWEPRTNGGPESTLSTVVRLYGLTSREASVLGFLAEGKTTAEIADELFCAQSTVRAHMSNASKKLGVHSREELVSRITEG